MAKNCVFKGTEPAISLPVPSGTKTGDPVHVGGFVGVAETDRNDGVAVDSSGNPVGYASVNIDGAYSLKVPDAVAAVATPIYIDGSGDLTTTATSNTLFGHTVPVIERGVATGATKAADSGGVEGTVNVRLVRI